MGGVWAVAGGPTDEGPRVKKEETGVKDVVVLGVTVTEGRKREGE